MPQPEIIAKTESEKPSNKDVSHTKEAMSGKDNTVQFSWTQEIDDYGNKLLKRLDEFRKSNSMFDLTLKAQGEEFHAHKIVLAACGGMFRTCFIDEKTKQMTQTTSVLNLKCPAAGVKPILKFAYTGKLEISHKNVLPVYLAAKETNMKEVQEICSYIATNKYGWIVNDEEIKEENANKLLKILHDNESNFDLKEADLSTCDNVYCEHVLENCPKLQHIFIEILSCLKITTSTKSNEHQSNIAGKIEHKNNEIMVNGDSKTLKEVVKQEEVKSELTEVDTPPAKEKPVKPPSPKTSPIKKPTTPPSPPFNNSKDEEKINSDQENPFEDQTNKKDKDEKNPFEKSEDTNPFGKEDNNHSESDESSNSSLETNVNPAKPLVLTNKVPPTPTAKPPAPKPQPRKKINSDETEDQINLSSQNVEHKTNKPIVKPKAPLSPMMHHRTLSQKKSGGQSPAISRKKSSNQASVKSRKAPKPPNIPPTIPTSSNKKPAPSTFSPPQKLHETPGKVPPPRPKPPSVKKPPKPKPPAAYNASLNPFGDSGDDSDEKPKVENETEYNDELNPFA